MMKDTLWLLNYDFKTGWKWHVMLFPFLTAIVFIFLKFSLGDVEAYFEQPVFGGDLFYIIGYSGMIGLFSFRENLNPKRLRFNDYHVPFIRLIREMNVKTTAIVDFYMMKSIYSITILNIVVAYMLYPNWIHVLSITDYIYFVLFSLGVGYILGFWSVAIYPFREYITVTVITTIVFVILIFAGSIIFFVILEDGFLGFVINRIKQFGFIIPILTFLLVFVNYIFAKRIMIRIIERRDFE